MIISHSLKYVFTHSPKTGGTSISNFLKQPIYKPDIYVLTPLKDGEELRTHAPTRHIIKYLKKEGYNPEEYFKFVFVRNPWDRMVSHYEYYLQHMSKSKHVMKRKKVRDTVKRAESSFKEFSKEKDMKNVLRNVL